MTARPRPKRQKERGGRMRAETCCFTGHRLLPRGAEQAIRKHLLAVLHDLIVRDGIRVFLCGGALGFDMLAGETVLALKKAHPHIQLKMILPCRTQQMRWEPEQQARYRALLAGCDGAVYVSETYTADCMFKRNRVLAEESAVCVAYLTAPRGGTLYTVNRAQKAGARIINLAVT